jgi:hypothetical protein
MGKESADTRKSPTDGTGAESVASEVSLARDNNPTGKTATITAGESILSELGIRPSDAVVVAAISHGESIDGTWASTGGGGRCGAMRVGFGTLLGGIVGKVAE